MSHEPSHGAPHGASTIHASKHGAKGGGGSKWLVGGLAAAVVLGGGYFAWKNYAPSQGQQEAAYTEPYSDVSAPTGEPGQLASADSATVGAAPAEQRTAAPTRRAAATAAEVPEETIGVTPVVATTEVSTAAASEDSEHVVVTAPRRPVWASTPSARRLSALYPARALERGREGEARLSCTVQSGGALDCVRVEETSSAFGAAALRVARTYRHAPTLRNGSDATGTPVNLRVVFRIEDDARGERFAAR